MKLKRNLLIGATTIISLIMFSCKSDDQSVFTEKGPAAVRFSSTVGGEVTTRASGTAWDANDKIGIFMKKTGTSLTSGNIIDGADNIGYTTAGSGYFVAMSEGDIIYYPEDDSSVDFVSYYPLQKNITDYKYNVDLSDQSKQEDIDLLYSNNATNLNTSNQTAELSFAHQLSRIELKVTAGEGVTDITNLTATVKGFNTNATFNLADGTLDINSAKNDITAKTTVKDKTNAVIEAIVLPNAASSDREFVFQLDNRTISWKIPANFKFEKGKKYTYKVSLKNSEVTPEPEYGWLEMPEIESLPNTIVVKHGMPYKPGVRNYSMLYDTNHKFAYWVAYPLHTSHYPGDRGNAWGYDPAVTPSLQPLLKSGWGVSGLDRGHQLPSGDRTASPAANATTFYYTNMTAQSSVLNQNWWRLIETQVRNWTDMYPTDTMYVVTGAMIDPNNVETVKDNAQKDIAKPAYYFKALAQRKDDNKMHTVAFKINNEDKKGNDFDSYKMTVKQLEQETGFKFFPNLTDEEKSTVNDSKWPNTARYLMLEPYNSELND